MVREVCPRCDQVYNRDPHNTDFVHDCDSGNDTLDNEDVVVIGNWEDAQNGEHIASSKSQFIRSTVDKRFGKKPFVDDDVEELTKRGVRKSTHGTRKHFEYIDKSRNGYC